MRSIKWIPVYAAMAVIWLCPPAHADGTTSVYMEELTWMDIQNRLQSGTTIVILPSGGLEQEGPHMVTGMHNEIMRYEAGEIAKKLGNALVAPVIPYVPAGRVSPTEGAMQFPGTVSTYEPSYSSTLEEVARSLKKSGFHMICLIGDHLGSQHLQSYVAQKLTVEWKNEDVKVVNVSDYFYKNGQDEATDKMGIKVANPMAHAGQVETAEMMVVDSAGVRDLQRGPHSDKDYKTSGALGDSSYATVAAGKKYLALKVDAAVAQIEKAEGHGK